MASSQKPRRWWDVTWRVLFAPIARDQDAYPVKDRVAAVHDLQADKALESVNDSAVPEFLLAQTQKTTDIQIAAVQALETKAAGQVGVAGTIIGLFAAFGRQFDSPAWSLAAILPLIASVVCSGTAVYLLRDEALPSPQLYNLPITAKDPTNKARLAMTLIESWTEFSTDLRFVDEKKARWTRFGSLFLVLGLILLLVASLWHTTSGKPTG